MSGHLDGWSSSEWSAAPDDRLTISGHWASGPSERAELAGAQRLAIGAGLARALGAEDVTSPLAAAGFEPATSGL